MKKKVAYIILLLLAFTIPLNILTNNIVIIGSILFIIIIYVKYKISPKLVNKLILIHFLYFSLLLIGLTYTQDINEGMKLIVRSLPFVIFPVVIPTLLRCSQIKYKAIFVSFSIATLLVAVYNQLSITLNDHEIIHRAYIGMFLNLSLLFFSKKLVEINDLKKRVKVLFFLIICSSLTILTGSKMQIIILFIILNSTIVLYAKRSLSLKKILSILLVCNLTLSIIAYIYPFTQERITKFINSSDYIRTRNWQTHCDIIKENLWMGVGTGDGINELNKLRNHEWLEYYEGYNSHNEYLEIQVAFGLIGSVTFLSIFFIQLRSAFMRRDYFYLLFLTIIMLSMLTESIFKRQKGIILYTYFSSIFICLEPSKKIK